MADSLDSIPLAGLRVKWDVFLSFRGEDTRNNIIKNLYDSLTENGVRVFKDDVGMNIGDDIKPTLLEAIEDSAASIIVLSQRYADSHWCLDELSRICQLGRLLLPVFYEVDPSHVRSQKGPFENDFRSHLQRFGEDEVGKWRNAMKKVGGTSGFVFHRNNSNEQQLIQQIVRRILTELRRTVGLGTYTVGLDSRAELLMKKLNVKSNGILVLGLHGMGGIGKTTLAKALYNKLINHFEHRCFISNIREIAEEGGGLISLQYKLLSNLFSNRQPVLEINSGISIIKSQLHEKQVLVVLDDVSDVGQLSVVAGSRDWFGEGSRIIITTRNKDVLVGHVVNEAYEVSELSSSEALQLFSFHALRREEPTDEYRNLSNQFVSLTGRLPLALEVFGSFLLYKRTRTEWEDALKKLQQIRPRDLQGVLRISFDELDEEEKTVFLDIACLFVKMGMKREEAVDILKGCGFRAEIALDVLAAKSLIKIKEENTLWIHDQLRDMGREIVIRENPLDPGAHSRLWDYDKIMTILEQKKGTSNVQGIILDFRKTSLVMEDQIVDAISCNCSTLAYRIKNWVHVLSQPQGTKSKCKEMLDTKSFESMANLRLLQISGAKLEGKFKFLPAKLKWLQWKECPLKYLPSDYNLPHLAVLDLSKSKLELVWGWRNSKVADKLRVMNLSHCYNLAAIPDFSGYETLEKLDLERCIQLTKLHKSLGNLKALLHLNLKECLNLVQFPSDVSGLRCLQSLHLSDCSKLEALPEDIGRMISLRELLVDRTGISRLPESIYRLTKLEKLSMIGCQFIMRLPDCLGSLTSLKELFLDSTGLEGLPDSVGSLSNLEKLRLMRCKLLTRIPESVGKLESLIEIDFDNTAIKELPSSIGSLSYLEKLSAGGCCSLSQLPDSIGGLSSIRELQLDRLSITYLPDEIANLKWIQKLDMQKCAFITTLPEAIGRMLSLTTVNLSDSAIIELPESIGDLENLIKLNVNRCKKLQKLPDSIGKLNSLHHLLMEKTAVTELPESFGMLSSLIKLKMRKDQQEQYSQGKLVVLPTSFPKLALLEELDARAWRISGKIPDEFEKLSKLEVLDLGCNNFYSLPSSLSGLSLLKRLYLPQCKELKSLPPLPSSLEEVDVANCFALEGISDMSNLESLTLLNLKNCEKVLDIPGLECFKSLTRLFMSGCTGCSSSVKRRLSKVCLRNIQSLSLPGKQIPDWFSPQTVSYYEQNNRKIRAVIIFAVVSLEHQIPDDLRDNIPVLPAIQAKMFKLEKAKVTTTLDLQGVPKTDEDQMHLCRYPACHPLVSRLKDGYKLEVSAPNPPIIQGVQLKKCGIHLVFEDDDDYEGNEETLDESQLSISAKLANFFNSIEEDDEQAY